MDDLSDLKICIELSEVQIYLYLYLCWFKALVSVKEAPSLCYREANGSGAEVSYHLYFRGLLLFSRIFVSGFLQLVFMQHESVSPSHF